MITTWKETVREMDKSAGVPIHEPLGWNNEQRNAAMLNEHGALFVVKAFDIVMRKQDGSYETDGQEIDIPLGAVDWIMLDLFKYIAHSVVRTRAVKEGKADWQATEMIDTIDKDKAVKNDHTFAIHKAAADMGVLNIFANTDATEKGVVQLMRKKGIWVGRNTKEGDCGELLVTINTAELGCPPKAVTQIIEEAENVLENPGLLAAIEYNPFPQRGGGPIETK